MPNRDLLRQLYRNAAGSERTRKIHGAQQLPSTDRAWVLGVRGQLVYGTGDSVGGGQDLTEQASFLGETLRPATTVNSSRREWVRWGNPSRWCRRPDRPRATRLIGRVCDDPTGWLHAPPRSQRQRRVHGLGGWLRHGDLDLPSRTRVPAYAAGLVGGGRSRHEYTSPTRKAQPCHGHIMYLTPSREVTSPSPSGPAWRAHRSIIAATASPSRSRRIEKPSTCCTTGRSSERSSRESRPPDVECKARAKKLPGPRRGRASLVRLPLAEGSQWMPGDLRLVF